MTHKGIIQLRFLSPINVNQGTKGQHVTYCPNKANKICAKVRKKMDLVFCVSSIFSMLFIENNYVIF